MVFRLQPGARISQLLRMLGWHFLASENNHMWEIDYRMSRRSGRFTLIIHSMGIHEMGLDAEVAYALQTKCFVCLAIDTKTPCVKTETGSGLEAWQHLKCQSHYCFLTDLTPKSWCRHNARRPSLCSYSGCDPVSKGLFHLEHCTVSCHINYRHKLSRLTWAGKRCIELNNICYTFYELVQ